MNRLKKIAYILSWIPVAIIKLALAIIGIVLLPFWLINMTQEKWKMHGSYLPNLWWLWDNKEEGCPDWWMKLSKEKNIIARTFPRWWWFAVRNPVNGFRYIFEDVAFPEIETNNEGGMEAHHLVANERKVAYRWLYKGMFAGYRRVWLTKPGKYSEIWFGWKIGSSVPGLGFTMQVRLNRDIGT